MFGRKRCKHPKIEIHSVQYWANTTNLIATCHGCGKSLTFRLGYVSDKEGEGRGQAGENVVKVAKIHFEALGYTQYPGDPNIWTKEV